MSRHASRCRGSMISLLVVVLIMLVIFIVMFGTGGGAAPGNAPAGPLQVDRFTATRSVIYPGQAVRLSWQAGGGDRATLDGQPVQTVGNKLVMPESTATFTLRAIRDGEVAEAKVTVKVVDARGEEAWIKLAPLAGAPPGTEVSVDLDALRIMSDADAEADIRVTLQTPGPDGEPVGVTIGGLNGRVCALPRDLRPWQLDESEFQKRHVGPSVLSSGFAAITSHGRYCRLRVDMAGGEPALVATVYPMIDEALR